MRRGSAARAPALLKMAEARGVRDRGCRRGASVVAGQCEVSASSWGRRRSGRVGLACQPLERERRGGGDAGGLARPSRPKREGKRLDLFF